MADTTRIIGYARVSTDDQDLSLQRKALADYGVHQIYEETISGVAKKRPALENAFRAMRQGDTVVVWKFDRLGRSMRQVLETVERMEGDGVHLVSLTEPIDTRTPMGKAFFHIAITFAQLERDLIAERTKAGMAVAKARGAQFGRRFLIQDYPKRLEAMRPYVESGAIEELTAKEALEILNRADTRAPKIKAALTYQRWLKAGCPGID